MPDYRKKVLVFGATGEMGGRVARGCASAGCRVTGVSRGNRQAAAAGSEGLEMVLGDKGDAGFLRELSAGGSFDIVVDILPSVDHLRLAFECFRDRIEHYFTCSSTGVYPPLRYLPADEEHPWREPTPVNFRHKVETDAAALELWREHGFPVTVFRPTNIIGPDRVPIETWGGREIEYWRLVRAGETVEIPGDGDILLQPAFNDDLASAFVLAAGLGGEISGEIFNISCRRAITLARYFEVAREILGSRSRAEFLPPDEILRRRPGRAGEKGLRFLCEHMCFDIAKASRVLGYEPRKSAEEGLAAALGWCRERGMLD